jgi:DNA-binding response OmpR family regulator
MPKYTISENDVPRILIADDDFDTRQILFDWLTHQGYECVAAANGETALALATAHPLDLALLDVRMPGPAGMDLAPRLKEQHSGIKIIIITAYGSTKEGVAAIRSGAFHYLLKPLDVRQVLTAVKEALSPQEEQLRTVKVFEDLSINLARREATWRGQLVSLTKLEFDVLAYLARHRERAVACDELLDQVWSYPPGAGDPAQVRNTVKRLRKKLKGDAGCPCPVVTVRGVGYRWDGGEVGVTG